MKLSPEQLFKKFSQEFGSQNWWPVTEKGAISPSYKKRSKLTEKQKLEICLGAILTQNTSWKNVEKAIIELNKQKMVDCKKIVKAENKKITELIRTTGYFNQKAKKLKKFSCHLLKNYNGKINSFLEKPLEELRKELLSIHGIGKETADSIILYAAEKPVFVVDAYTKRIVERYYGKKNMSYESVKIFFESSLGKNAFAFNEMHALLVEFAKRYCRKQPLCEQCFLNKSCAYYSFK